MGDGFAPKGGSRPFSNEELLLLYGAPLARRWLVEFVGGAPRLSMEDARLAARIVRAELAQ